MPGETQEKPRKQFWKFQEKNYFRKVEAGNNDKCCSDVKYDKSAEMTTSILRRATGDFAKSQEWRVLQRTCEVKTMPTDDD